MYSCYLEGGPADSEVISTEKIQLAIKVSVESHEYKLYKKIGNKSLVYRYSGDDK